MPKPEKNSCLACGNNQVPSHFLYWYFESTNVLFAPIRRFLLYGPLAQAFKRIAEGSNISFGLVKLGQVFRILLLQPEIQKCKVSRAKVLWEEAVKRGIVMRELLLLARPFDCYVAEKAGFKIVFCGLPRPRNYNDDSLDWMDDKWLFKKKLIKHNFPVPQGGSTVRLNKALKIFNALEKPAIVKPRLGSRGRHSTTFVQSGYDLKTAFQTAKQLCHWVIVEEQLSGPVFRVTLINFELCGVLRGDPPSVTGDGSHSIKELIEIKNRLPHLGVKDIVIDGQMERFLNRQQLNYKSSNPQRVFASALDAVPGLGKTLLLSEKIGVNYGGSSAENFEICHPDNSQLFVKAARLLGDPIVGFDFIIPDITKSWRGQKCGFIEANSLPFINLHHDPLHGKPRNVAAKVWDMMGLKHSSIEASKHINI